MVTEEQCPRILSMTRYQKGFGMQSKRMMIPALCVILVGSALGQLSWTIAGRMWDREGMETVLAVHQILRDEYVKSPDAEDAQQMEQAMIEAMVETLGDPHTFYISPKYLEQFEKNLRGRYGGIGAYVDIENDYLKIISPMDASPALAAGVRSGDVVLTIEGESTFQLGVNECIERLTGEPGSPVEVTVRHEDGTEETITLIREQIHAPTVMGVRRSGRGWSYCVDEEMGLACIRVTGFNGTTMDELTMALEEAQREGLRGLILDLRDNPGGALSAAVAMSDLFLPKGVIVSVRPRSGKSTVYAAHHPGTLEEFPMIVMVNDLSASASEIVAGALQSNGRAKVLGTRSFGKGSVQEVRELPYEAGELKFTVADYYLPDGRNLNRNRNEDETVWGVDPDPGMVIPMSDEARSALGKTRQISDAIRDEGKDIPRCTGVEWIRGKLGDIQLATAVEALRDRVTTGAWPSMSEEDSAAVAFNTELTRVLAARSQVEERLQALDEEIAKIKQQAMLSSEGTLQQEERDGEE